MADQHSDSEHGHVFAGPWWAFPVMRDALAAGALIALTFGLSHLLGFQSLEPFGYSLAASSAAGISSSKASPRSGKSGKSELKSS